MTLALTYAGAHHPERTLDLENGLIKPDRVNLTYRVTEVAELFTRMVRDAEFPVAEMSMSSLISLRARGDDRLIGIPIFPSRAFRLGHIYVHVDSGITGPADLVGRL